MKSSLTFVSKLAWAYARTHRLTFLLGIAAGLLLMLLLPTVSQLTKIKQQPQTIGLVGNVTIATLPRAVQEKISLGLTRIDTEGQATSAAATQFYATDSGKKMIFVLNSNLLWHDGKKFSGDDASYSLKGASLTKLPDRIEISLTEPYTPLPVILSQPLFRSGVSRSLVFLPTFINELFFKTNLVGLGDYRVEKIKRAGRFISHVNLRKVAPPNDVLIYKFYPSTEDAIAALKLGQIDKLDNIFTPDNLENDNLYQVNKVVQGKILAVLFFNLNDDLLREKAIRQALTYALPDILDQGETAFSPLPKASWATNPNAKKYSQNLALAKSLWEKTGTGSAERKPIISLVSQPLLAPTARLIAAAWAQIGVETKTELADFLPPTYQAYLGLVELPADPDQYTLWHSTQTTTNLSNYKSPRTDRLLEEGRRAMDFKERMTRYTEFQKAITEDLPAAFLFYPYSYTIEKRKNQSLHRD